MIDFTSLVKDFETYFAFEKHSDLFGKLESALTIREEFYEKFRQETQVGVDNQVIEESWDFILKDFGKERIVFLEKNFKK